MNILVSEIKFPPTQTSKEYNQGWNANILDKSVFSNPYFGCENHDEWLTGFRDCQKEWNNLPIHKDQPNYK